MEQTEMVKLAQMDLLVELDRICKKHNIRYFLCAGTLIGAIRHEGFIPWDDDLDVAMLREDYERLRQAMAQELDPAYYLHDWHSDPYSPLPYCKLKIRNTHYVEAVSQKSRMDDGVFIDIFPYDSTPADPKLQKKQKRRIYVLRRLLMVRAGFALSKGSFKKKLLFTVLKLLSYLRSMKGWKRSFEKLLTWEKDENSAQVTNLCGAYSYEKETVPRAYVTQVTEHVFEGRMFCIPVQYDALLRHYYGDYMTPPPADKRVGIHGVKNIDFGDYQIRYGASTPKETPKL